MLSQEVITRRWRRHTTEPAVFCQDKSELPGIYICSADCGKAPVVRSHESGKVVVGNIGSTCPPPTFHYPPPDCTITLLRRSTSCRAMSDLLNGKGPLPDWSYA